MNSTNPTQPHPQRRRMDQALHLLREVAEHWDEDELLAYPEELPSFDEYVARIAQDLRAVRWDGEED